MKNYGYKVCYREKGKNHYVRYFKTYTYKQALSVVVGYIRYPPRSRENGHKLKKPKWKIIRISRSEVLAGIWDEPTF